MLQNSSLSYLFSFFFQRKSKKRNNKRQSPIAERMTTPGPMSELRVPVVSDFDDEARRRYALLVVWGSVR